MSEITKEEILKALLGDSISTLKLVGKMVEESTPDMWEDVPYLFIKTVMYKCPSCGATNNFHAESDLDIYSQSREKRGYLLHDCDSCGSLNKIDFTVEVSTASVR